MESEFSCTLCGRCCNGFGRYIRIDQQTGTTYRCTLTLTRETFRAIPDPGRSDLLKDRSYFRDHPHACPFLRKEAEERIICTIHGSRPRFCREYVCCTGRIGRDDIVCGEMKGRRDIKTDDPDLTRRWSELVSLYGGSDDTVWKQKVQEALQKDGYTVVYYG
ncbi:Fe-S-cluster containining protein [Methanocalculus alkaliphilus]|uniref:YkgJ family cysteine cluster protein n=1 Tax=Methanocalculus alkaliphilus TaxID=768730 RepID=UPI0020A01010|nr:YkgJ family cysteine cluster protein [Methanocalculus alkaliphilus]MCP1714818.1 Fe-S-cluster containining protein [Methanocalculus alkaliphilus]